MAIIKSTKALDELHLPLKTGYSLDKLTSIVNQLFKYWWLRWEAKMYDTREAKLVSGIYTLHSTVVMLQKRNCWHLVSTLLIRTNYTFYWSIRSFPYSFRSTYKNKLYCMAILIWLWPSVNQYTELKIIIRFNHTIQLSWSIFNIKLTVWIKSILIILYLA